MELGISDSNRYFTGWDGGLMVMWGGSIQDMLVYMVYLAMEVETLMGQDQGLPTVNPLRLTIGKPQP